jgi:predicted enzyme related to lactoylglutathione lyase
MARTAGFDHVAIVTADLDRIVAFYQHVFDARITFEMAATQAHPRMVILDLGGGSALNITEQAAGADVGQVQRLGDTWSLFFRDPDEMELEVCTPIERS